MAERSSSEHDIRQDAAKHIADNVDAIARLYEQEEQRRAHSGLERAARFVGAPRFLYSALIVVLAWVGVNAAAGARAVDPPPFFWLQGVIALSAWLTTTVVLISQNRQGKLAEQRAHIDLQINLLAEKKIAKLIALVEELRRDLPSVGDRKDPEAQAMARPADPHAVARALDGKLDAGR
jgi:uncharacterized membrane protein